MNHLVLSALDYRTPRKANMHFIARELAARGPTRFFSLRYSVLSRFKNDARAFLDARANRVETIDGVDCYLWKTLIHPFNTRRRYLRRAENLFFGWSQAHPPAILCEWMREADAIVFESGSSVLFIELAERINPSAKRIYVASDDLQTIGVADYVERAFVKAAPRLDALCLPSPLLARGLPPSGPRYLVPHGLDASIATQGEPNPYTAIDNAVSVGSMLFDRRFFEVAERFPQMLFHVIGSGTTDRTGYGSNVVVYDEMPYLETIRYIKHARFGIAPYAASVLPAYLADTSMKMMQYRYFGKPVVCPRAVVGSAVDRFGYDPGSVPSIESAIRDALEAGAVNRSSVLTWSEVVDRLMEPTRHPDTSLT